MVLYGHRGAKGEAPENTLPGFAYAYAAGLRAFELDVRLSADRELVICHDATVDRTTNGTGAISALTYDQLSRLDARADFPDWPEPCRIPMLTQVFESVPPDVRFEIEIKRDESARLEILVPQLVENIRHYSLEKRVTLSSFDAAALKIAQRIAPALARAYIGAYDTPQFLETALTLGCVQADIPLGTGSHEMVRNAHGKGLRVTGWPGDTIEQLRTLADWNVDAITTNVPGSALLFLHERGLLK